MFWGMFLQVAQGLQVLHDNHIVHDGLTSGNILIGENNTPKISDFDCSRIRTISAGYSKQPQQSAAESVRWKPRERLVESNNSLPRYKSDVYALGMCMIEAKTQALPFGMYDDDEVMEMVLSGVPYEQPYEICDDEWSVISRLIAVDIEDRPDIGEVILMIRKLCEPELSFPIEKLVGCPPSRKVLASLYTKSERVPESEKLCLQMLERLQFLHDAVSPLPATDGGKQQYVDVIIRFLELISVKPLLVRLGRCETFCATIHHLHVILTEIGEGLGLGNEAAMTKWSKEWDSDCADQRAKLVQLVTTASDRSLVHELHARDEKQVHQALMVLKTSTKETGQSTEISQLKKTTLERVLAFTNEAGLRMFDWFIDVDDIKYSDTSNVIGTGGSFGDASLGTWFRDGQPIKVVVKHLFPELASTSDKAFFEQLELWWRLPRNEHILELYGGSHVSRPPLFVNEYAPNGNLREVLGDGKHQGRFWPLFLQVAKGLKFLHQHGIVHGGLKCSNILVDAKQKAKIGDFGFRNVLAASVNCKGGRASLTSVRWKPVEVIVASGNEQPKVESDIYSLGMCIIEAMIQAVPFGNLGDDKVSDLITAGKQHPRPDAATDKAWELISRMCASNIRDRPTIREVIAEIIDLSFVRDETGADKKRGVDVLSIAKQCVDCGESRVASERFCRQCGFYLSDRNQPPAHEPKLCYLSRPKYRHDRIAHAWCKAFETAVALKNVHDLGIFHGNLKPTNIRIGNDGRAKLSGFELSGRVDRVDSYKTQTIDEAFRWQAPQVLAGEKPSLRTDLYSLGMCIITVVSFGPPWGMTTSDSGIKEKVLSEQELPPRAAGFTDEQWKLVTDMILQEDVTIGDVVRDLKAHVHEGPTPEWIVSQSDVVVTDEVFSRSPFFSRHKGSLLGARVTVEKLQAPFDSLERSSQTVVELWFRLRHPNILQLFGAMEGSNPRMFVCEYAAEGELTTFLKRPTPPNVVWRKLLEVAYALRYMHVCGISHGEVTSQNIFVTAKGVAKLSGFALSCPLRKPETERDEDDFDTTWVPPSYVCEHHRTFASDVFWLGKLIIDAVTGHLQSTDGQNNCDICTTIDPTQKSSFTSVEWQLVSDMRCCDPKVRITMAQVVDRLAQLVAVNEVIGTSLTSFEEKGQRQQELLDHLLELKQFDAESPQCARIDGEDDPWFTVEDVLIHQKPLSCEKPIEHYAIVAAKKLEHGNPNKRYDLSSIPIDVVDGFAGFPSGLMLNLSMGANHGGFGKVQQGMWLGAPVAVKTLNKIGLGEVQEFFEEVNIWNSLRHPNIVNFFGACLHGYFVFVSDFVNGGQLNTYLAKDRNRSQVWELLHDAALGLQWLHLRGIVHADLKCNNIVVGEGGHAKLIDFGLSLLGSCKALRCGGAVSWRAPETLTAAVRTFASDVYSFGMCIVEALSGRATPWGGSDVNFIRRQVKAGVLPSRPTCFTLSQWELVKRMCCLEPESRLKINDVVKVLSFFANRYLHADGQDLKHLVDGWVREGAIKDMREHEQMCLHTFDRLHELHQTFFDTDVDRDQFTKERFKCKFDDIKERFSRFLLSHTGLTFVTRLANNRTVVEQFASFHKDIRELKVVILPAGDGDEPTVQEWENDRRTSLDQFKSLADNDEVLKAERFCHEGLAKLKIEVDYHATRYITDEVAEQHYQLMQATLDRLTSWPGVKIPAIPHWFIPRDDVDFDADKPFGHGSYGSAHRSTWSPGITGDKTNRVVIKCVNASSKDFCKEVDVLQRLDHPHVLKVYGGCHVESPIFFVCDDATQGSFQALFKKDKSHLWRMFHQAALGLEFLHSEKVVHGNLKCSNLLLGSDNKAKLCDFGFSYLRNPSVGSSGKLHREAIRWMAPECLPSPDKDSNMLINPCFASDVYSLGMCIIEAFLGDPPYGSHDVHTIRTLMLEPYPRPPGRTEDEWELVEKLVHPDASKRMSLDDAIASLKMFADREEVSRAAGGAATEESKVGVCGDCDTSKTEPNEQEMQPAPQQHSYSGCDENDPPNTDPPLPEAVLP